MNRGTWGAMVHRVSKSWTWSHSVGSCTHYQWKVGIHLEGAESARHCTNQLSLKQHGMWSLGPLVSCDTFFIRKRSKFWSSKLGASGFLCHLLLDMCVFLNLLVNRWLNHITPKYVSFLTFDQYVPQLGWNYFPFLNWLRSEKEMIN